MDNSTNTIELSAKAWDLLTQKEVSSTIEDITPKLASELLSRNKSNRKLNTRRVIEYAAFMKKGQWTFNGETIIISNKGVLRNGQHRLNAVIASGCSIKMLIVSGVEDETYRTLDQGKTRTGGDVFAIEGFKYANIISAGLREYICLQKNFKSTSDLSKNHVVSIEGLYELALEKGQERCEALASKAHNYYNQSRFYPPSLILAFVLILDELHPGKWMGFMDKVFNGIGLETHTPEYALVSALKKEQINKNKAGRVLPAWVLKAWFIKAFNYSLTGKKVLQMKFDAEREAYPLFIGQ